MIGDAVALVRAWLLLDFFGESRSRGQDGSSLTSTVFTQSFLALVLAAILFDSDSRVVPYAAANLSLSTVLVGIGTLTTPDRKERLRADSVLVETAPIARATLPLARTLHGGFFIVLVTTGMAIPPAVLLFWVSGGSWWIAPAYLALASICAGLFAGALALFLRGWERWQGAARAALVGGTLKAALLGVAFAGFALCMPHLRGTADELPIGSAGAMSWPPYWAARWLAEPLDAAMFGLALIGLGAVLFALAVVLSGPRRRPVATPRRRRDPLGWIERSLAGGGPLLGATSFVSAMLYRSPGFRARVLPLFGIPIAMMLLASTGQQAREQQLLLGMTLQFPAIYLPFLVLFLPFAEHEGAAWLFETSPHHSVALAREASLLALSVRILLPIQLVAGVALVACGFAPAPTVSLIAFSWGLATLFATIAIRELPCMPFTATLASGDDAPNVVLGGLLAFAIVLAAIGGAFALIAATPAGAATAVAIVVIAVMRLRRAPRYADAERSV